MAVKIPKITQDELKRVLIVGCHLHQWQNKDLRKVIQEQGMVQLDPLNPAGRYHDIFFSSRIKGYHQGDFEGIMYPEKLVFETYYDNLKAVSMEWFPLFYSQVLDRDRLGRYYSRALRILEQTNPEMLKQVLQYVQSHGVTRSSDLISLGKADPRYAVWKTSRNSGTALELLWAMGKLAVIRDKNFRKEYDLIENYVAEAELIKKSYQSEEQEFLKLTLKIKSYPVISVGKLSFKKNGEPKFSKKNRIPPDRLLNDGSKDRMNPSLVQLKGNSKGYIVPSNWIELSQEALDDEMRAIGPLDPIIWDRNLLKIFNFDYVWEVYKKPQDRKWGYYVYPLLYCGNLIGRLEAKYEKKSSKLQLFNFQAKDHFTVDSEAEKAFSRLHTRWKNMVRAEDVEFDNTIPF